MPKKALVVRGGWEGHAPVESTNVFIPHLDANGYEVQIEDSPEIYADAAIMTAVDLVVQCYTMGVASAEAVNGLRTAVAAGTGLAGWHGGIADSFRNSSDYLHLIGGQFACHPAKQPADRGPSSDTDNFLSYAIEIVPTQSDHPIVAGIGSIALVTEQYWVLTDNYVDVLATTTHAARPGDPWHRPVTCPAVWTRTWGYGRIFVATPGHQPDILADPSVKTIIERGLLWASR